MTAEPCRVQQWNTGQFFKLFNHEWGCSGLTSACGGWYTVRRYARIPLKGSTSQPTAKTFARSCTFVREYIPHGGGPSHIGAKLSATNQVCGEGSSAAHSSMRGNCGLWLADSVCVTWLHRAKTGVSTKMRPDFFFFASRMGNRRGNGCVWNLGSNCPRDMRHYRRYLRACFGSHVRPDHAWQRRKRQKGRSGSLPRKYACVVCFRFCLFFAAHATRLATLGSALTSLALQCTQNALCPHKLGVFRVGAGVLSLFSVALPPSASLCSSAVASCFSVRANPTSYVQLLPRKTHGTMKGQRHSATTANMNVSLLG